MTRKQRRGVLIGVCLAVLGVAVGLVLFAMRDSIVFFYSPSEVTEMGIAPGQRFRLGGLVETGSVVRGRGPPFVSSSPTGEDSAGHLYRRASRSVP